MLLSCSFLGRTQHLRKARDLPMFGYISKIQGLNVGSFIHKMNHFHKKIWGGVPHFANKHGQVFCWNINSDSCWKYTRVLVIEGVFLSTTVRIMFIIRMTTIYNWQAYTINQTIRVATCSCTTRPTPKPTACMQPAGRPLAQRHGLSNDPCRRKEKVLRENSKLPNTLAVFKMLFLQKRCL